ncbi:MAG: LysR substrate-binding domain-containing protein [Pseudomonadota bacterium]
MARTLPPLNALRAFEAAGRHGSFSRAAEELSVSHSAVSRHVRGLEGRLGVSLFQDLPRGVALTPEGRTYLERVLPAFDEIAAATEDLSDKPKGQITVNSEPVFAERFMMPRLARFRKAFPDVELRLEASNRLANIEHYEADMAVRFAHLGRLDVPSDLLSDARISVYAAPQLAAKIKAPADLLHLPRLRDRHNGIWELWFKAAGVETDGSTDDGWRPSTPLSYVAALEGMGAYLSSAECVSHDVAAGRLVQCFDTAIRDGAFFLVYGSRGTRSTAAKQVRRWLLEETGLFRSRTVAG